MCSAFPLIFEEISLKFQCLCCFIFRAVLTQRKNVNPYFHERCWWFNTFYKIFSSNTPFSVVQQMTVSLLSHVFFSFTVRKMNMDECPLFLFFFFFFLVFREAYISLTLLFPFTMQFSQGNFPTESIFSLSSSMKTLPFQDCLLDSFFTLYPLASILIQHVLFFSFLFFTLVETLSLSGSCFTFLLFFHTAPNCSVLS